ncbi:type I-E CRISPR-associated protein Cas6/Cse3/CasE [Pectobacterium parmentieri]|uniref:CRISPR-associated protein, Cse3 family n=1 Tax=Pectobacterium parmentieri TaxID=1905730 RepID=A0A0H3HXE7_PECPM|nr:type I-E CRISPR-associated protein Cas6/Cse3/CasE [Pectobacterium parmentieri]AFI88541.1 CRISPR-associated protein, Cse3 family [Pectobacterium parmentieri]MBI0471820.1 type I-E CRISPR-associated protein Cas6/Cse3/CasE [Pectobacterium parmentieri]MBI0494505.1 type I-E CRISPR-associated protein Cas6/Cse3/CasE [Pectobacterium parmentieri]MBI0551708.1 type I-E CRISPR-associated protein Cas6/Cse3/CasE [Pectobacterium parmentieri]MBI0555792.1 type I-E CRISPR-associated protein Cas6/Cse3/CasE [Pe
MYFSRITLNLNALPHAMATKRLHAGGYASHQWLWQLFPDQPQRSFLFREEEQETKSLFYLLSEQAPQVDHNLFRVETKPYQPQWRDGMTLAFSLRANPVVTRDGKRSDVLMDARHQAKAAGLSGVELWQHQQQRARDWLVRQGENAGFTLSSCCVDGYQRHRLNKPGQSAAIVFSSVDYDGMLHITDAERFAASVQQGLGKSKALGCGLLLLKRA